MKTGDGGAGEINVFFEKKARPPFDVKSGITDILMSEKKPQSMLNVIFTGDAAIKKINLEYRMTNRETDVIAFEFRGERRGPYGDVYISLDTAKKNAEKFGVTLKEELARLVTHGTLHVIGYDHLNDKDEKEMSRKTEKYMKYFCSPESGIRNPESRTKKRKFGIKRKWKI